MASMPHPDPERYEDDYEGDVDEAPQNAPVFPLALDDGGDEERSVPLMSEDEIPAEVQAAWAVVYAETGALPTHRAMAACLRAQGQKISNARLVAACQVLRRRAVTPPRQSDAINEAEIAVAKAEQDLRHCAIFRAEAEARVERINTELGAWRMKGYEGDPDAAGHIQALEHELKVALQAVERQVPAQEKACAAGSRRPKMRWWRRRPSAPSRPVLAWRNSGARRWQKMAPCSPPSKHSWNTMRSGLP